MGVGKGVTLGTRVLVCVGVRGGVLVAVGVRVGLGVRVLVGVLLGWRVRVGCTTVTTRVVPGVVVSMTSTISIAPAVPTVVGVGKLSSMRSGGPKSQPANTRSVERVVARIRLNK